MPSFHFEKTIDQQSRVAIDQHSRWQSISNRVAIDQPSSGNRPALEWRSASNQVEPIEWQQPINNRVSAIEWQQSTVRPTVKTFRQHFDIPNRNPKQNRKSSGINRVAIDQQSRSTLLPLDCQSISNQMATIWRKSISIISRIVFSGLTTI